MDTVYTINADGSRNFMQPADVTGPWQLRVNLVWAILILVYVGLPWLVMGGHPAVYFDLPHRQAYLFGVSLTNQDFYLAFFVLTGIGFGLITVTALFGRIWCGFACPQTVFLEGVFRRFERWIEGPRNLRIRRNLGPLTFDKAWRKTLKHVIYVVLSLAVTHVFLSYFIPARELIRVIPEGPAAHPLAFGWTVFFSILSYINFFWFREQTCLILCPYGRLQSALIDNDTIVIGYDTERGEPRSKRKEDGGDCIDCFRCVEVCPTGIDIRNGLQLECLGCTRCIDACDDVMDKIDRPRGLVRYDSRRVFEGGERQSWLRPRLFLYLFLGLLGLTVAGITISRRLSFHANVLRAKGLPYVLEEGRIRNLYTLHLQNKQADPVVLEIEVGEDPSGAVDFLIPQAKVRLAAMEDQEVPVFAFLERNRFESSFEIGLVVSDSLSGHEKVLDLRFRGP